MSNCPVCNGNFDTRDVSGATVALCAACDGTWLFAGTLDRITGRQLEAELATMMSAPTECRYCGTPLGFDTNCVRCQKKPTIQCPGGHGVMEATLIDLAGEEVEIDRCPSCRGIWIDGHERSLLEAPEPRSARALPKFAPTEAGRKSSSRGTMDAIDRLEALQQRRMDHMHAVGNAFAGMSMYGVSGKSNPLGLLVMVLFLGGAAALIYFVVGPMLIF